MKDSPQEGYFGIGIVNSKRGVNIGTLWRSAYILGANYIFTIGKKYKKETSDVLKTWSRIPLFQYSDFDSFYQSMPYNCQLIAVELDENAQSIVTFEHPKRGIYLLGAEDNGLPQEILSKCHDTIFLPGDRSLNVAVAGSIVLYDRVAKMSPSLPILSDQNRGKNRS